MLGDLVTKVLVLLLGYGYPAFECFKTVESRPIELRQLQFWCQYWTIVGIVTVLESIGDVFISWLPMYGEAKLAFFIYLWHSKTMGTTMVYEAFLRPLVVKHEPDIEKKLRRFRAKSGDLLLFYIKNFSEKGQSMFLELLHYVISKSSGSSKKEDNKQSGKNSIAIKRSKHSESVEENSASSEPKILEIAKEFLDLTREEEEEEQHSGRWRSRHQHKK